MTKHHQTWPCLISLDGISSLKNITATDAGLDVGASVVLSNLESACDADWPALARMLRFFGSRQIKNLATVGGNLCNASPIGDLAPILLALDARLTLASRGGERTVPIDAFFLSYRKTALNPGEILSSIHIPRHSPSARIGAYKVSKRRELDISAVAAGMFVQLDDGLVVTDVRLGWGGMAATPARARQTEDLLRGQVWCEELIERGMAQLQAEFTPLSDHRGTDWYRTTVAANLLRGFFLETRTHPQPRLPDRPSGTVVLESS